MRFIIAVIATLAVGAPTAVQAQGGALSGLLEEFNGIRLSGGCWQTDEGVTTRKVPGERHCFSSFSTIAFTIMGDLGDPIDFGEKAATCESIDDGRPNLKCFDITPTEVTFPDSNSTATEIAATATKKAQEPVGWYLQPRLGVGYSRFDDLGETQGLTTTSGTHSVPVTIRGEARELPSVTFLPEIRSPILCGGAQMAFAVGPRIGVISLANVRASFETVDESGEPSGERTTFDGAATTFEMGFVFNAAIRTRQGIGAFIEAHWMNRDFESVRWTGKDPTVPSSLPASMSFNGWGWEVGLELNWSK